MSILAIICLLIVWFGVGMLSGCIYLKEVLKEVNKITVLDLTLAILLVMSGIASAFMLIMHYGIYWTVYERRNNG